MKPLGTLVVCLLALTASCKSEAQTNAILARAKALSAAPEYIIGNGDQVTIQVLGEDQPTVSNLVRPDGKVAFPGHGDIQVEGKTVEGLRAELEKSFTSKDSLGLRKPKVFVERGARFLISSR